MQTLRICSRISRSRNIIPNSSRMVSSIPRPNPPPTVVPWFLDPSEQSAEETIRKPSQDSHASSSIARPSHPPLPADLPSTSVLGQLYDLLKTSPHLEPGTLLVREPIPTADGPPLPAAAPKGRRQRGRTYFGEGVKLEGLESGGLWNWIMVAQVKAGTEKRGAIESVVRLVRKALLTGNPPLTVPHSSKRKVSDGWAMLDAGDFAVHILSGEAREKFFPDTARREW